MSLMSAQISWREIDLASSKKGYLYYFHQYMRVGCTIHEPLPGRVSKDDIVVQDVLQKME